jgi:hypothetical protein
MRKRIWITGVLAIAILLLLIFSKREHPRTLPAFPTETNQQASEPSPFQPLPNLPPAQNATISGAPGVPSSPQSGNDVSNKLYQQEQTEWHKPIYFYGKVVDENSNAVSGAHIRLQWRAFPDEEASTAMIESDAEGLFKLEGKTGRSLIVSVEKPGYFNSRQDKTSFLYSLGPDIYTAQQWNPVIFHLQKKSSGEALIENNFPPGMQIAQLKHDGTPVEIDLLNGQKASVGNGQLKLEFWRDISEKNANKFDWRARLSVPDGGIVSSDKEFLFQAPETGYQPFCEIDMPKTNQNWVAEIRDKYYVKLPDGKYGRLDFYLLSDNGVFTVHSAINPTGSRNLEPK